MSDGQREIYHSENGDKWLLCHDRASNRVYIEHQANLPSGGKVTPIEIREFIGSGRSGPEHQALFQLIAGLVRDPFRSEALTYVSWDDVNQLETPGQFPFRDGTIDVNSTEISIWKTRPDARFKLMRKHPIRGQIAYVLGSIADGIE